MVSALDVSGSLFFRHRQGQKVKVTRSNENCAQNIKYMPKTSLDSGNIPVYRKSRSLNTMVTADFRPEAELMLFLRMHAKEIAKSLGKCIPIEELFPYYRKSRSPEQMAVSYF